MVEYNGARLYRFYFYGITIPVTIEAVTLDEARQTILRNWRKLHPPYQRSYIINETVTVPLEGVSTKLVNGIEYTWVGYRKSKDGWQSTESLEKEAQAFADAQNCKIHSID
jgi:hypothetical protein